ncbi:hypothetical protein F5J12DRAFT_782058 [Pisolithus orientalis]|uniref:uncharacterized protein n=1 Tax=Pisolithus orientalis TaxID=936130 RepID=UPI002224608B|nr:uncharacterized protein F5J12DRAFT_782058 [Pisolithus orientalis]KAI6009545.1 hypothetical protein F5J12DRAFT_782058 [Pisolithus orientalis]
MDDFEQASLVVFAAADVPGLSHDQHGQPQVNQHHKATPFMHKTTAPIWPDDLHQKDTCWFCNKTPFPGRAMKETNTLYAEEEVSDSDEVNQLDGLGAADELPTLSKRRPAEMIEFTGKIKDGSKHQGDDHLQSVPITQDAPPNPDGHGNKWPEGMDSQSGKRPLAVSGGDGMMEGIWKSPQFRLQWSCQGASPTPVTKGPNHFIFDSHTHLCSHGWVLNIDIQSSNSFQQVKLFSIHPLWQTKYPMEYASIPEFIFGKLKPGGRTPHNLQAPQGGVKSIDTQFLAEDISNPQVPMLEDQLDVLFCAEGHQLQQKFMHLYSTWMSHNLSDEEKWEMEVHGFIHPGADHSIYWAVHQFRLTCHPIQYHSPFHPNDQFDPAVVDAMAQTATDFAYVVLQWMDLCKEAERSLHQITDLDDFYDPFAAIGLQQFAAQPQYLAQHTTANHGQMASKLWTPHLQEDGRYYRDFWPLDKSPIKDHLHGMLESQVESYKNNACRVEVLLPDLNAQVEELFEWLTCMVQMLGLYTNGARCKLYTCVE